MAWSDPGDFTSGQILTAAQMDSVREAMFFGQATFTNEAARDAAIPATGITLQEGMRAYLTAPTVPAATGTTTAVPSGVTTVYNGSEWVCVSPVAAFTSTAGTRATNSYGALTGGGTNPSVTLVTGTTAIVTLRCGYMTLSTNIGDSALLGVAVSGAGTVTSSDSYALRIANNTTIIGASAVMVLSGLTAGTNTFTLEYKAQSGTGTFVDRQIIVQGIA